MCAIFETRGAGLELRVSYGPDRLVHSERLGDLESARLRADQWLDVLRAAGSIDSISLGGRRHLDTGDDG